MADSGADRGRTHGRGARTRFFGTSSVRGCLYMSVDVSDASGRPDPVKDVEVINGELESFGAGLETKPVIMVASKIDVAKCRQAREIEDAIARRRSRSCMRSRR